MMKVDENYIEGLLQQMTLDEKIGMVHGTALFHTDGIPRLGIPPLVMSDGPSGVRFDFYDDKWIRLDFNHDNITYIPCNSAVAASWNKEAAFKSGNVLGEEGRGRGKDVMLAPGVNIKRTPYCGRNFEYFSEDPYLTAELAAEMIKGIQKHDVAACVKHFCANNQETDRMSVDTIVDERTLREIYYPAFINAIKEGGTYSLMSAYNKLNGEHCCTSEKLLNDTLRSEWGYDGAVISDWGGVHDTDEAVKASIDVEMDIQYDFDQDYLAEPLKEKIDAGEYDEHCIDDKVRNILRLMYRLKMIGENTGERKKGAYNTIEHRQDVLDIARESVVLLKNDGVLPLDGSKYKKVAVIGENAIRLHSFGGGSSEIKALYEICPYMGIMKELGGNAKVSYAPGYFVDHEELVTEENWQATSTNDDIVVEPHYEKRHISDALKRKQAALRKEALELAKDADLVIFVGGLNHHLDLEGGDRKELNLPYGQDKLIEALTDINENTVVVLMAGSPVAMPWLDKVKSVVWTYYAGMEGGTAIADVLFGNVNPSGHLPETFIKEESDNLPIAGGEFAKKDRVEYREGISVGYRQYDTGGTDVLFPFGYGLSYTSFEYETGRVAVDEYSNDAKVSVEVTVTNTGDTDGAAVVQLYVSDTLSKEFRPVHELKAFEKVNLVKGESRKITFTLDKSAFDYFDTEKKKFYLEPGEFIIELGENSRDIKCWKNIEIVNEYTREVF
jgi:beta-glucosidase